MSCSLLLQRNRTVLSLGIILPSLAGSACAVSSAANSNQTLGPCNTGSCFVQYQCHVGDCNDKFHNNTHPDDNYLNEDAWNQCQDGASTHRSACVNGDNPRLLTAFWDEFIDNLKSCIDLLAKTLMTPLQTLKT